MEMMEMTKENRRERTLVYENGKGKMWGILKSEIKVSYYFLKKAYGIYLQTLLNKLLSAFCQIALR